MGNNINTPKSSPIWKKLEQHFQNIKNDEIVNLFSKDPERMGNFHIKWNNFILDYSKNRIDKTTIKLFIDLLNDINFNKSIQGYFSGEKINQTENRAVLHTALRSNAENKLNLNGENIIDLISNTKKRIKSFSQKVINGQLKGYTNQPITDIVNIGIGGSDLGPSMVVDALKFYKNHLNIHFISNVDGDHLRETIKDLNPETTLVVIVSKSFTTQETLINAKEIKKWFDRNTSSQNLSNQFVAVTSATDQAMKFGITEEQIFPMWDWVGGRFSLWSAVGLSICLSIGFDNFEQLLLGAKQMDDHFKNEPFEKNIPVILALISVWYNNFFQAETEAIITYSQALEKLVPYLQQAVMESNGKSIDRNGDKITYQTGTIIWGQTGTNSQHAFFQLIHQGTKLIPCDFIGFKKPLYDNQNQHDVLMANFFAQTEALMVGKSHQTVKEELTKRGFDHEYIEHLIPYKIFDGNKPSNTILIDQLTPKNLGSLIAMYEHKIFTQGILWNIFSYDQWGVELGKELAGKILPELKSGLKEKHDHSTNFLIEQYNLKKIQTKV